MMEEVTLKKWRNVRHMRFSYNCMSRACLQTSLSLFWCTSIADTLSYCTFMLAPMLCTNCHRRKSILPGVVAYLKRPPTFMVS